MKIQRIILAAILASAISGQANAGSILGGLTVTVSATETDSLRPGNRPDFIVAGPGTDVGNPATLTIIPMLDPVLANDLALRIGFDDAHDRITYAEFVSGEFVSFDVSVSGLPTNLTVTNVPAFSGQALKAFDFSGGTLNFSTDNSTVGYGGEFDLSAAGAGVPEPATWLTMILGFASVGVAARRRRWPAITASA